MELAAQVDEVVLDGSCVVDDGHGGLPVSAVESPTGRMAPMRFVILGAGAVGGTVGALLHDSGHDVVLVARGAHAAAIGSRGLRVAMPSRVLTAHLPVVGDAGRLHLHRDDVLMLATKSQDTVALLDSVAALPVDGTPASAVLPVFCVQNGVANERMAARRFADVHGVVVM